MALLLVGVLALTTLLAVSAITTERYQRAQAERVLRDYASLAAQSYGTRAAQTLFYSFTRTLDSVGLLRADSAIVNAVRANLVRYGTNWAFALLRVDSQFVVYRLDRSDSANPRISGFVAPPAYFRTPLRLAWESGPMLPRALAGGLRREETGSITVTAGPIELYRSAPPDSSRFRVTEPIGDYFGDLRVHASLQESAAGRLIIGGLPRSRLPFLATLFLLASLLVVWALVQLRRERRLSRMRDDFVAGVSHELRTPLAQVRMFAETLLLDRVRSEDERRRSLAIIDQEARRLAHLVDNILHFTRSSRVALSLEPRRMPLAPLLHDVVEGFRPLASNRRTTLRLDAPEGIDAPVDEPALRQVLINLLDNAVKYGPDAQEVTVRLARTNGEARVAVEDQGPGIPERDRKRVWQRFVRLARDRGTAVGGSGIGLAVVRELVELHGGRCWIEQADGGGTRVVVALPAGSA